MPAPRKYGKSSKRSKAERLFAELPQSPVRKPPPPGTAAKDAVTSIADRLAAVRIQDRPEAGSPSRSPRKPTPSAANRSIVARTRQDETLTDEAPSTSRPPAPVIEEEHDRGRATNDTWGDSSLRVLTWDDVCPSGDGITKIAEASYAEVYRVSNERGTSIIKVIRLESPIKPQTKAQVRSGLVDEEPHAEADVDGELQISEWLADIPGFVVYKERYLVQGRGTKQLLETHQAFQRRMKKQDPGRAQFYPSPSRYLDQTKFLVIELGDAGTALEDWELTDESQLWDIFLLEAIALARAEDLALFEHRDLHEGNLCVKQARPRRERQAKSGGFFGHSGLDITILDYGLSRAEDPSAADAKTVAFDLETDLSLFTSTHASQCKVYRQMRSFLLRGDRQCIPPEGHRTPYARGVAGPLSWDAYAPYTNVLWLAYLYEYLGDKFGGPKRELARFRRATAEMWRHLDPEAGDEVPCFGSAADVVCFAVEAGWIREDQLCGAGASMLDREDSIIVSREELQEEEGEEEEEENASPVRRSPRRRARA
ncbi:hypothetical protein CDD83_1913 [Cordyceps sp. RAO-2017]|nr:hypothetical protein CDD83_1913 [Cordyceps sp. RAO-2017]